MPTNSEWYWNRKRPNGQTNYQYYQGTKERKKYRSWLNKENRKKWNYWNWDKKDLHHVGNNPKSKRKITISEKSNRSMWAKKANDKRRK